MRPTPQLWAVVFLAIVLAACAIVFARPELLFGTALLGAWGLVRQYHFSRLLTDTLGSLSVAHTTPATVVQADNRTPVSLAVRALDPVPVAISVEDGIPPGARRDGSLVAALDPGETRSDQTVAVTWPVAGRHRFLPATLVATDGWFRETIRIESSLTVTVESRGPSTVHVGSGGERVATANGEHRSRWLESGPEFDTVREYLPGDAARRIDWNASARLATLYVRELEGKSDRPTLLAVDLRAALRTGTPGETKLDYLREAALTLAASAHRFSDPLGLVALDDEGVRSRIDPEASTRTYRQVRHRLFELGAVGTRSASAHDRLTVNRTEQSAPRPTALGDGGTTSLPRLRVPNTRSLTDDPTTEAARFVEVLRPFYEARPGEESAAEDFVGGLNVVLRAQNRRLWAVLCTDDSSPRTLWESVTRLRERGHRVLVLLAPTVLFESDGLADLETAYDRYVAFEEFRRELNRKEGVRALEVAPDERLAAVLAAGRDRRRGDHR